MSLAKILVDPEKDIGVVVVTNFPGPMAEKATGIAMKQLYGRYAPKAQ